jgi:hypothetical protein
VCPASELKKQLKVKKKGKTLKLALHVITELSTMPWRHMGSGGIAPPFLTSTLDGDE